MKCLPYILVFILVYVVSSCSNSRTKFERDIDNAERVMQSNADSALAILETIDPSELKVDSLRAKYHYLMAYGHFLDNRSMIGDSLISFAHGYYHGKDIVRDIRSGMVFAWPEFIGGKVVSASSGLPAFRFEKAFLRSSRTSL